MKAEILIRPYAARDAARCCEIYNYYIVNTTVTFEEEPLSPEAFGARAAGIEENYPYFVAEADGVVLGYAYLAEYNPRSAYRYTVDLSIYLARDVTARGVGSLLYERIERAARERGFANIISIITRDNAPSVAFHEKHGFRHVGTFDRGGVKFDRWLDVAYYQKRL